MKILNPKRVNLISGGSLFCEGYAQVLFSFEQQYKGYEIYRGWDNDYQAFKEYSSKNVSYYSLFPYIVYTTIF